MTEYYPTWHGGSMDVYKALDQIPEGTKIRVRIPGLLPNLVETQIKKNEFGSTVVEILGYEYFLGDRSNGHPGGYHEWTFLVECKELKHLKFEVGSVVENTGTHNRFILLADQTWVSTTGDRFANDEESIQVTICDKAIFESSYTLLAGSFVEVE
jgi:hypothetical protein